MQKIERWVIEECKKKSILHYLLSKGINLIFTDKIWMCSSPFSSDSTWSFAIYKTNTFYCWSTGRYGDILDLIRYYEELKNIAETIEFVQKSNLIEHDTKRDFESKRYSEKAKQAFDYTKHINTKEDEVQAIFNYAASRGITSGFLPGKYHSCRYTADGSQVFTRHAALMFLHTDLNGNICGAKFRNIDPSDPRRFTARGDLGFYVLNVEAVARYEKVQVWLCESETSANSLWEYLKRLESPSTIISMGGVGNPPKGLPSFCQGAEILLVIDYDGNEELYQQRIKKYEHLKCKPIKMILPKGEDINSLYATGRMYLVEHLLLNN